MPQFTELPFSGTAALGLLERLASSFEKVRASGEPLLVILEAESGCGKSRLIQELYRHLAEVQGAKSRYWPPSILEAVPEEERDTLAEPEGRRKRLYPENFVRARGALPEWFWWGITARRGVGERSLENAFTQIEEHRDALERRWRKLAPRSTRAKEWLASQSVRGLAENVALSAVQQVPLIGYAPQVFRLAVEGISKIRPLAEREIGGRGQREEAVSRIASELAAFAAVGIPIIIAVEDLHDADDLLVEFLVRALATHAPVLVLATTWPGELRDDHPGARLLSEVAFSRRMVLTAEEGIGQFSADERMAFVEKLLPTTSISDRRLIADRYRTAYLLEIACGSQEMHDLLSDGALTSESITKLPERVEGFWNGQWERIPSDVRDALMLAILASPASIADLFAEIRTWDAALPVRASATTPWATELGEILAGRLDEEGSARAWVRRLNDWLRACHEPQKFEIARERALKRWTDARRNAYWERLAASIDLDAEGIDEERTEAQAQILAGLAAAGVTPWDAGSIESADLLIAAYADAYDATRLELAVRLSRAVEDGDEKRTLVRRQRAASSLRRLGRLNEAIAELRRFLVDAEAILGTADESTFEGRRELAFTLGQAGLQAEEAAEFKMLWQLRMEDAGPRDPATLRARAGYAGALGRGGNDLAAVAEFQDIVIELTAIQGAEHPDTLHARGALAGWLYGAGKVEESITEFTRLLEDLARSEVDDVSLAHEAARKLGFVLREAGRYQEALFWYRGIVEELISLEGLDGPAALNARVGLAATLGQAGDTESAVIQLRDVVVDYERTVGRDAPRTIAVRIALTTWLRETGRLEEALKAVQGAACDASRALGQTHPQALSARLQSAVILQDLGRHQESVTELESLLADHTMLHGSDHPETLDVRGYLAAAHARTGNSSWAVQEFNQIIAARSEVHGAVHPKTLEDRFHLASWLESLGRYAEQLEVLEALLHDQEQLLGAGHRQVLDTRRKIAISLAAGGDQATAHKRYIDLLEDRARTHGTEAPETFEARGDVASSLGHMGEFDDAIRAFQELVADRERVQGVGHPQTLDDRGALASWMRGARRFEESILAFTELLADQARFLDADHPLTLQTRSQLATTLVAAGRHDEGLAVFQEIVEYVSRISGTSSPAALKARRDLLETQAEMGRPDCLAGLEQLLADCERVFSDGAPETQEIRRVLTWARDKFGG